MTDGALRAAMFDDYGVNVVDEALGVAIASEGEMEVNRERWRAARDAIRAALAASPAPAGLDAERLARAMENTRYLPADEDGDLEGHWDEWTVAIAREYAALASPDSERPDMHHEIGSRPDDCLWCSRYLASPDSEHKPVWDDDVPTGWCSCGKPWSHVASPDSERPA